MIQKAFMAGLIFGVFPELLGMLITKWNKNENIFELHIWNYDRICSYRSFCSTAYYT